MPPPSAVVDYKQAKPSICPRHQSSSCCDGVKYRLYSDYCSSAASRKPQRNNGKNNNFNYNSDSFSFCTRIYRKSNLKFQRKKRRIKSAATENISTMTFLASKSGRFWLNLVQAALCFIQFGFMVANIVVLVLVCSDAETARHCCVHYWLNCTDEKQSLSETYSNSTMSSYFQGILGIEAMAYFYYESAFLMLSTLATFVCSVFGFACLRSIGEDKRKRLIQLYYTVAPAVLFWYINSCSTSVISRQIALNISKRGFRIAEMCQLAQTQIIGMFGNAVAYVAGILLLFCYSLRTSSYCRGCCGSTRDRCHLEPSHNSTEARNYASPYMNISSSLDFGKSQGFSYRSKPSTGVDPCSYHGGGGGVATTTGNHLVKYDSISTTSADDGFENMDPRIKHSRDHVHMCVPGTNAPSWPPPPNHTHAMAGENVVIKTSVGPSGPMRQTSNRNERNVPSTFGLEEPTIRNQSDSFA